MLSNYDRLCYQLIGLLDDDSVLSIPNFDTLDGEEQRIIIEVCKRTPMTPERWETLNKASREPWLEEARYALEKQNPTPADADCWNDESTVAEPAAEVESPQKMTWQEVANRLRQLMESGQKCPSRRAFAKQLTCSPATVQRAIASDNELTYWASKDKPDRTPRASSLDGRVLDSQRDRRELSPQEAAMEGEFIENADQEMKAWYYSQSRADQLDFLNDPDEHPKILGRKA